MYQSTPSLYQSTPSWGTLVQKSLFPKLHVTDFNIPKFFKIIHDTATIENTLQVNGLKFQKIWMFIIKKTIFCNMYQCAPVSPNCKNIMKNNFRKLNKGLIYGIFKTFTLVKNIEKLKKYFCANCTLKISILKHNTFRYSKRNLTSETLLFCDDTSCVTVTT